MNAEPLLRLEGVSKSFGPVRALSNVDLDVHRHEIHGLLGGNGAGKTTLMNVLYGLYRPDAGTIRLRGQEVMISSPRDAISQGIGMVHQHFLQVNSFTVTQNIVLGTDLPSRPTLRLDKAEARIAELSQRFGLAVDPRANIEDLSMGVRQRVEILKALYRGVDVLILDEPTTNLTPQEVDSLFVSLKRMVAEGMSVVFITHKLREVMAVCDMVSVMRTGRRLLTLPRAEVSEAVIVQTMVGSDVALEESLLFSAEKRVGRSTKPGDSTVLEIRQLMVDGEGAPALHEVSLQVGAGEILGIAGVAGNGQQELLEALLNIRPHACGHITVDGVDISGRSTAKILALGVAYVPEDRLQDGFLPAASVAQNLILGAHRQSPYSNGRFLNWKRITERAGKLIDQFNIQTQGPKDVAAKLSGGNIQRMMLARAFSSPVRLLLLHNPTSGLDIPSVEFVYEQILARRRQGMATLLISDDLDELLLLSDRIAVMFRGGIVGELGREAFDKYEIGRMMSGINENG